MSFVENNVSSSCVFRTSYLRNIESSNEHIFFLLNIGQGTLSYISSSEIFSLMKRYIYLDDVMYKLLKINKSFKRLHRVY